jgi:hypothetical protein
VIARTFLSLSLSLSLSLFLPAVAKQRTAIDRYDAASDVTSLMFLLMLPSQSLVSGRVLSQRDDAMYEEALGKAGL